MWIAGFRAGILTREAMYVSRNIEARSRNQSFRWKAISIAHSECVSAALVIQHAMRMRRIILSSDGINQL